MVAFRGKEKNKISFLKCNCFGQLFTDEKEQDAKEAGFGCTTHVSQGEVRGEVSLLAVCICPAPQLACAPGPGVGTGFASFPLRFAELHGAGESPSLT